jgi:hypothetical protein
MEEDTSIFRRVSEAEQGDCISRAHPGIPLVGPASRRSGLAETGETPVPPAWKLFLDDSEETNRFQFLASRTRSSPEKREKTTLFLVLGSLFVFLFRLGFLAGQRLVLLHEFRQFLLDHLIDEERYLHVVV